jgi:type IV secretory pathway VirB10-like protein
MPAAIGPRFVLEAGFLVLLAVVVGFADLSPALIILVMTVGWLLVSLIEYFAWRQTQGLAMSRHDAVAAAPVVQEQVVEDVVPPPPPPPPPPAPAPQPAEEETVVQAPASAPEEKEEKETVTQADERVAAARASFTAEEKRQRHRLDPLHPRPRRRWILFGPHERRPESPAEGDSEEER